MFVTPEAVPSSVQPGDCLRGEISLLKGDDHLAKVPARLYMGGKGGKKDTTAAGDSAKATPAASLADAVRDTRIAFMAS